MLNYLIQGFCHKVVPLSLKFLRQGTSKSSFSNFGMLRGDSLWKILLIALVQKCVSLNLLVVANRWILEELFVGKCLKYATY